uniref:Retrovirus-related Pol polyprotein from transposon TNT 1-94 n=1 Tax=Tanacetum cinerariifolium TaxID=118510 RepID=A0A6L2MIT5_TANCI|nr:retrovirus-related Pol polyprotein from transposon TNT 1-94 [Tanacetum cinerariifolium]
MILLSKTAARVAVGIMMLKIVRETPLQFGVTERLSRTFRVESTRLRAEAPKMLWVDSVSTNYLIYYIPYVLIGLRIPEEECRGKDTSLAHLKAAAQMKGDTAFGIRRVTSLMKPIQKSQVVLVDIPKNLAENDNIVAKHELSLEITQSPGGSSDTSEGSENNGSFEDSGRSDEEDSKDRASSNEGGFETLHKQGVDYNEIFSPVMKMTTFRLVLSIVAAENFHLEQLDVKTIFLHGDLDEDIYMTQSEGFQSTGKEENLVCILKEILYGLIQAPRLRLVDVHQVGDEREVEVLRNFNWPPSELITEDGVLPERERKRVLYVRRYVKVRAVALLKGRRIEVYRDYLRQRAVK